ncbi:MAG: YbgA family protein [Pseudomonadota bacterium]
MPAAGRIPVGISSCLLGARVRFDGGHRRSDYCAGELAQWFAWVPVCPESAIGLGTPREAVHLRRRADGALRLVGARSGADHTDAMTDWSDRQAAALAGLCGYVVAKKSPTCGLERVRVYRADGTPERGDATGLYVQRLRAVQPLLPVEEDGRLNDPLLRENFVMRVFVLWRWRQLGAEGITAARLLAFHTAHKYLLMAHSIPVYRRLGRLLADLSGVDAATVAGTYIAELMQGLEKPVTRSGHSNVLQHIAGYFRNEVPPAHRHRLQAVIDDYRCGLLPLAAPLTLIRHFLADHPDDYLARQVYLAPHPETLRLRAFL